MAAAKKTTKKKPLLGKKLKFNKVQALGLVIVLAAVGILAFALTHAAAYPAHLVLTVSGPANQSITFTSGNNPYDGKTHDVGTCYRSFAVHSAIQCDGNTIGPVSITAPVVSGYTFSGWQSCNSTSPSGASCNLAGYSSGTKYITAVYRSNTPTPTQPPQSSSSPLATCNKYSTAHRGVSNRCYADLSSDHVVAQQGSTCPTVQYYGPSGGDISVQWRRIYSGVPGSWSGVIRLNVSNPAAHYECLDSTSTYIEWKIGRLGGSDVYGIVGIPE